MSRSATATSALVLALALASLPVGGGVARAQPTKGEDESAALVDEGRAELKAGNFARAGKALDQAIALNARRVDAYVLRAAVYAVAKQYKQGIELMERARALAPNDPDVLTSLASLLVLSGDVARGIPLLEGVVAKFPERYDAQLLVGLHDHKIGKWPEAIVALEAYFKSRPAALASEDGRHRVDLADSYLRDRKPKQAIAQFEQAAREQHGRPNLRTKIGLAWAMSAIDCKRARSLLRDLEPALDAHPEIGLVDGQCALALGDAAGALALGRRFLEKVPRGSAAAHALIGEALAARGNLADARKELETARTMEPARRRWTDRYAHVLRRAGDLPGALAALDQLGPPASATSDPDWWREWGEATLAKPDPATAVTKLAPIVAELPTDGELHVIFGAAQLETGQAEAAIKTLDESEAIAPTSRAKKLLVEALGKVGATKLAANDAAGAQALLARADTLLAGATEAPAGAIARNLGIAMLVLERASEAVPVLDRAVKASPGDGTTLMLAARAHALAGDVDGARALYEKATAVEKTNPVELALDWAAMEIGKGGDLALAVTVLEKAAPKTNVPARLKAALADARHAAGLAQLRAGNASKAVELLRAAAASDNALATKCDLAVAAVAAVSTDGPNTALAALKAISGQSCPFPPPADTQAAPILVAFVEGVNPRRAAQALDKLTGLGGKSTGAAAALLGTAIRVVALNAAQDAYASNNLPAVRRFLTIARGANARIGNDEVAHDLALVDLADGKLDAAIAQLERVSAKVPEALVNLGIAYDRKQEPLKALDAWRRAKKAGVRFAPLADWIESKERIYGEGAP